MGIRIPTKRTFTFEYDNIIGAKPKMETINPKDGEDFEPYERPVLDGENNPVMEGGTHYQFSLTFDFVLSEDFDYTKTNGIGLLKNALNKSLVSVTGFDDEEGRPLKKITPIIAGGILDAVEQIDPVFMGTIIEKFEGLTVKK